MQPTMNFTARFLFLLTFNLRQFRNFVNINFQLINYFLILEIFRCHPHVQLCSFCHHVLQSHNLQHLVAIKFLLFISTVSNYDLKKKDKLFACEYIYHSLFPSECKYLQNTSNSENWVILLKMRNRFKFCLICILGARHSSAHCYAGFHVLTSPWTPSVVW